MINTILKQLIKIKINLMTYMNNKDKIFKRTQNNQK